MSKRVLQVVDAAKLNIIPLKKTHYSQVAYIYEEGLATGIASFETEVPSWEQWNEKFLSNCQFVAMISNKVIGWCALSATSKREVYQGVAENTLYVSKKSQSNGVGKLLLERLISTSEQRGFWTLQASIFPQNTASIHLHKKCGFRVVGTREKIAQRDGIWHDNILMERRIKKLPL